MENDNREYLVKAPTYQEVLITFTANEIYTLNKIGNVLAILDVSGSFKLSIDEQTESDMRAGITFKMGPGERFRKVRFRETAGAVGNITVAVADGEIYDARANITGNTPVINAPAPNDSLQVDLIAADPGLVALAAAIVANQNNDETKRSHLTTLEGATFAFFNGNATEQTVVAAGANLNGIIIRYAQLFLRSPDDDCYIGINDGASKLIVGHKDTGSAAETMNAHFEIRDIFIPAGVALVAKAETASSDTIDMWYEVL